MIVFLDIDGVLVHLTYNPSKRKLRQDLDPKCVEVLNRLTKETNAKIVVSSAWRHFHSPNELRDILEEAGVQAEVVGTTPPFVDLKDPANSDRGEEILKWIQDNNYIGDYVVIDDDVYDIEPHIEESHIIYVSGGWLNGGLQEEHIEPVLSRGMIT
jgi:hypothetical protein